VTEASNDAPASKVLENPTGKCGNPEGTGCVVNYNRVFRNCQQNEKECWCRNADEVSVKRLREGATVWCCELKATVRAI
jgi:hypothetical protein